jgi:hypothetical protein
MHFVLNSSVRLDVSKLPSQASLKFLMATSVSKENGVEEFEL